jgi:hypothetical protein
VSDDNGSKTAGSLAAGLITDQLDAERARHTSLEQRGISVITTSGTLITLLLAIAGLTGRTSGLRLPQDAQLCLRGALILLPAAAIVGIFATLPGAGRSVGVYPGEIKELMENPTPENTEEAQLKGLNRVSRSNRRKSAFLLAALLSEAFGIGFLAATVWLALKSG